MSLDIGGGLQTFAAQLMNGRTEQETDVPEGTSSNSRSSVGHEL